jgi:hypothetical protein
MSLSYRSFEQVAEHTGQAPDVTETPPGGTSEPHPAAFSPVGKPGKTAGQNIKVAGHRLPQVLAGQRRPHGDTAAP